MIERYTRPIVGKIWSDENKFRIWLDIELAALKSRVELGELNQKVFEETKKKAKFDVKRISELEEIVKHDVIAFLTNVTENTGPVGKELHFGMTSSDVLDTCIAIQLKQSSVILQNDIKQLLKVLRKQALLNEKVVCIGRTHGVHAELTTLGLKFALWYEEMNRNLKRLKIATENISVGKFSGAVGTYEHLNPKVEEIACKILGLKPSKITTQVIQRDLHAEFITTCAIIGSTLEKIATEIRHLHRTEVGEAEEPFTTGQKGSSAMPHKKNPILCERICGLARILRSNAIVSLENNILWHERDISHSSAERVILPDTTILLDYMLDKLTKIVDNLKINKDRIAYNIKLSGGTIYSQKLLLKLIEKGISREDAYKIVQNIAFQVRMPHNDLIRLAKKDKSIKKILSQKEIEEVTNNTVLLNSTDYIFKKLGLK